MGERDAWVSADSQRREALRASANEVRAALRFQAREGFSPFHTAADLSA